jgi:molybdopterin molybdotransferase
MISADEALHLVLSNIASIGVERRAIVGSLSYVLAEEIRSPRDIPGFDNSAMDGYALRCADVAGASEAQPVRLRVLENIPAGKTPTHTVGPSEASRIMTGAPMPPGADAVVPMERTRGTGESVEILASCEPRACVRPRGEDVRQGDIVLRPGKMLSPADLGMLASLNRAAVDVYRRPRVAIVSTGDELVDIDQVPGPGQIVNSNAYSLYGAAAEAGGEPTILRIARDRRDEINERLQEALSFDLVVTSGGVSVGQFDFVKEALDELGMQAVFHGVAQRPGRPLKFGLIGKRPVFGLPGNPVSTLVCFYLYARPAIRKMAGRSDIFLPRLPARCAVDIKTAKDLTEFVRVRFERRDGELYATPTGEQGSGILSSLSRADGLLIGPAKETILKAGAHATVLALAAEAVEEAAASFEDRRFQSH